jgi:hypothetical protein
MIRECQGNLVQAHDALFAKVQHACSRLQMTQLLSRYTAVFFPFNCVRGDESARREL